MEMKLAAQSDEYRKLSRCREIEMHMQQLGYVPSPHLENCRTRPVICESQFVSFFYFNEFSN
jgi:hypothetical protein